MGYRVEFDGFCGSFQELVRAIKRGEIDIMELPLAELARGYLRWVSSPEARKGIDLLNDIAENITYLSELIRAKSQGLLMGETFTEEEARPEESLEDDPSYSDDWMPTEELELRLRDYRTFLEAAKELRRREEEWGCIYPKPGAPPPGIPPPPLEPGQVRLEDLLGALKRVLLNFPREEAFPTIPQEELSVKERMEVIMQELEASSPLLFGRLFQRSMRRVDVIATFLALLELIRLGRIYVRQEGHFGEIEIYGTGGEKEGDGFGGE